MGELLFYNDSDFAGYVDSRKRALGYEFLMDNVVVAWCSKKQAIVTLSITEAEYMASSNCACQAIWFKRVLMELRFEVDGIIVILYDNTSTCVRFHFLWDLVSDGEVSLEHCDLEKQVADIFKKPQKEKCSRRWGVGLRFAQLETN